MALQSITNISLDFRDPRYLMINAKQYDDCSRQIHITCYDNGELYNFNNNDHVAFVKFKKPDEHFVFDFCEINYKGIIVVLTEQMLATSGICEAEIVVINRGTAIIDADTGEITTIDNNSRLATMTFYVNVYETTVDNSLIESSDEFLGLNDTLYLLTADLSDAVQKAKSWAVGDTGLRENEDIDNSLYHSKISESWAVGGTEKRMGEDTDNSKYYSKVSKSYAVGDSGLGERKENENEDNAKHYYELARSYTVGDNSKRNGETTDNAKYYYEESLKSARAAKTSETNAKTSETNASKSASSALTSETNAKTSETNAKTSETNAKTSETNAKTSETNAKTSETNAIISEENARISAHNAGVYVYGGYLEDNPNTGEVVLPWEIEGAQQFAAKAENYYHEMVTLTEKLNGNPFTIKGAIPFVALSALVDSASVGDLYQISEDFVTDETFYDGGGVSYEEGTNVYWANGVWNVLIETRVMGVKGNNETLYRKGNVNLTAENIGAVSIADISTVSEMKNYLGI